MNVYSVCFFVGFGLLFTLVELVRPARRIDYRAVLKSDVGALALYQLLFAPGAFYVVHLLEPALRALTALAAVPWPVRVVLYFVLADFSAYWLHRLMHAPHVWRIHRWHHSPTHMYWLAGIRSTLPQQVLFNIPGALYLPVLIGAPGWVFLLLLAEPFLSNDWMHANVTWRSSRLEWVVVTPRYHHIHHSDNPHHHGRNLGVLFTVWDRLFGTYVDPDEVEAISFGIGTRVPAARLALGL